jgi:hypothetical protein
LVSAAWPGVISVASDRPWAAHSYNVAFSDEIGHFEYCDRANQQGNCVNPGLNDRKKDTDDTNCSNADGSLRIQIGGCFATDTRARTRKPGRGR